MQFEDIAAEWRGQNLCWYVFHNLDFGIGASEMHMLARIFAARCICICSSVCPSVCLSQAGVLSERLSLSLRNQRRISLMRILGSSHQTSYVTHTHVFVSWVNCKLDVRIVASMI